MSMLICGLRAGRKGASVFVDFKNKGMLETISLKSMYNMKLKTLKQSGGSHGGQLGCHPR